MRITQADIEQWVLDALGAHGGRATVIDVAKYIWENHEDDLTKSGDMFYKWQYVSRWAAQNLRSKQLVKLGPDKGTWELVNKA